MKKKKQKELTVHEMAVRLCEGGSVWYLGHNLRAGIACSEDFPCDLCHVDCECHEQMAELCRQMDWYDGKRHYLIMDGLK